MAAVVAWLRDVAAGPDMAAVRLTALTELLRCGAAPTEGSGDATAGLAATCLHLLDGAAAESDPAPSVSEVSNALGPRVSDRTSLIAAVLRRGNPALWAARSLINSWRGHYDDLIAAIGAELRGGDPRRRDAAASTLLDCAVLAAPAAGDLADSVASSSRTDGGELRPALRALAGLGAARALPAPK